MSGLIQLHLSDPDAFTDRATVGDVVDAHKMRADYESNAPTGVSALPSMSDVSAWEQILIGLSTESGQTVTPERAKRCATVLAIMRGLSEDMAGLDLPLYKRGEKEDTIAVNHPAHRVINIAPNAYMTPMELREHLMFDAMLWGGWFNLKNMSEDFDTLGDIGSLWPLQAGYVTRRWRELVWTFTDPTTGLSGEFTPDLVWRGTILSGNGLDGTAITLLCRDAIGLLLAAEQQGARLFRQGIQTDFALETTEALDDNAKTDLRKSLMLRQSGSHNAFLPLLLEGGMKATKIGLTAVESQYLEAREYQTSDVARAFRYPEVLLGGATKGKTSTYASAEQFFESYTKHTLGPWGNRIQQTTNRDLLTPKEQAKYYFMHSFNSLLKANETARIANWNSKIQGGWAQPSEARRAEGMPWKEGLDYFSIPAGSTGTAGAGAPKADPQQPDPTQTDQSGKRYGLAARVSVHLLGREEKALVTSKQSADSFYTNFGPYIESMTGADPVSVRRYLELRRNTPEADRFSSIATDAALLVLTALCHKEGF